MNTKKTLKSFRLSDKACRELSRLAYNKGISQSEALEQCIAYVCDHYRVTISDCLTSDVYNSLLDQYDAYIKAYDGDTPYTLDEYYYFMFLRGCFND